MATKTTVGSAPWIAAEEENVDQLMEQEREEMIYPAQHELEWLNEHMADIFSRSHVEMANVFKTPGKMRGKTPHTLRKRHAGEVRIPLSDVFSSQPAPRSSPAKHQPVQSKFAIARDTDTEITSQTQQRAQKSQADSGYQGSSQMDDDNESDDVQPPEVPPKSPLRTLKSPIVEEEEVRTTEGSFHSAKEDQTTKILAPAQSQQQDALMAEEPTEDADPQEDAQPDEEAPVTMHPDFDEIGSPSDESTPDRPLVRKGSMTFATLPAREPLKQSIGARQSRTSHVELAKSYGQQRDSHVSKRESRASTERPTQLSDDEDLNMEDSEVEGSHIEILGRDESTMDQSHMHIHARDASDDESQALPKYNKAATQSLHAKLEALASGPAPRMSKSIPSAAIAAVRKSAEEHEQRQKLHEDANNVDDDDEWIKPLQEQQQEPASAAAADIATSPHAAETDAEDEYDVRAPELIAHEERMQAYASPSPQRLGFGHAKSHSTATLISPAKAATIEPTTGHVKSVSVSNPALPSTTPQGSPKRFIDGTLSASKSRLQSIMNSAKGLFTKSAGVSAAAKMEAISPAPLKRVPTEMPGMYPTLDDLNNEKPLPPNPPAHKTRSSTERQREEKRKERDQKAAEKVNADLEKARQREAEKAAQQHVSRAPSPRKASEEQDEQSGAKGHAKLGRPVRPTRDVGKTKPPPAVIKLASASARMQVNTAPVAAHHQESIQGEPKRPGLTKKASTQSMSSTSTTTFKTSVSAQPAKPRALLAAERKKEQDERDAQRKQEQKRELEKKRALLQEEARKKEQKEREEAERKERERLAAEQRKRQAQQEAIERKRQEATRKAEHQRQERAAQETAQSSRPASRLGQSNISRTLVNHHLPTNPAKPPKRVLEDENARPQPARFGAASQQADTKRRRTEDEQPQMQPSRPTMTGPPIRQSNFGKKPSIFTHSAYQQQAPLANSSSAQLNQFPQPPRQAPAMQHFANSKIPFADPPAHANLPNQPTKTPLSAAAGIRTITTIKSSPHYLNGDNIHLPDIPTDSEDEDSEDETANAFPLPDWATPGHLADQLMKQDDMDVDAVFGPIAPLRMEEIFAKGNKDRLKKLRDRTSSANWVMSGDGLTLEEVRADREQRERMKQQGGWRYGGN